MAPSWLLDPKHQEKEGAMKQQMKLPCIPRGATAINNIVGVFRDDNIWTYFLGGYPIHSHKADDRKIAFESKHGQSRDRNQLLVAIAKYFAGNETDEAYRI